MSRAMRMLLAAGAISRAQFEEATLRQRKYGETLSYHLVNLGAIADEALLDFMIRHFPVKHWPRAKFQALPIGIISLVPPKLAGDLRILPLALAGKQLTLGITDPSRTHVIEEAAFHTSCFVTPALLSEADMTWALRHYYGIRPILPSEPPAMPAFLRSEPPPAAESPRETSLYAPTMRRPGASPQGVPEQVVVDGDPLPQHTDTRPLVRVELPHMVSGQTETPRETQTLIPNEPPRQRHVSPFEARLQPKPPPQPTGAGPAGRGVAVHTPVIIGTQARQPATQRPWQRVPPREVPSAPPSIEEADSETRRIQSVVPPVPTDQCDTPRPPAPFIGGPLEEAASSPLLEEPADEATDDVLTRREAIVSSRIIPIIGSGDNPSLDSLPPAPPPAPPDNELEFEAPEPAPRDPRRFAPTIPVSPPTASLVAALATASLSPLPPRAETLPPTGETGANPAVLTDGQLITRIGMAQDRDTIIKLALTFLQRYAGRAAFLVVRSDRITGFDIAGADANRAAMRCFWIPTSALSTLRTVIAESRLYLGPLGSSAADHVLAATLGGAPKQLLALPVTIGSRVVALLLAVNLLVGEPPEARLTRFAEVVGENLERLLLER